ncbi:MAG: hypothetical protein VX899_17300 [Myxococcota bacterium]|nr:hypothetical protein [Myxococcota bacterium]
MLLLLATSALAAWPDDVTLSNLATKGDTPVLDPADNRDAYDTVLRELGVAIANKPMYAAESLGPDGFEVGVMTTIGFHSAATDEIGEYAPWERVDADGDPGDVLLVPWIMVRKGLLPSLDVGANLGWVGMSRQTAVGGYARLTPLEGYHNAPDLAFQVGYSGYVGNNELELGVLDWSGTISYSLPFGALQGINNARFAPFAGVGQLIMHGQPRLSDEQSADLGLRPVSGFTGSEVYDASDPQWRQLQVHGGFMLVNRGFHFRAGTAWTPQTMPTINLGLGFTY